MGTHLATKRGVGQQCGKRGQSWNSKAGAACMVALALLLATPSFAQQAATNDPPKPAADRKKPAGRLPAYFAAVVTPQQRETIYKLQADYEAQLEKLRAEMAKLIAERSREVEQVLDAGQLAEVNKKREEAQKKRAARSSSRPPAKTAADS